jgi:hypothetical protein
MEPTNEQSAIIDAAGDGRHLLVEALAGTGKTTTMEELVRRNPGGPSLYIAFNRSIVDEATEQMPPVVRCATVHELAYRAIGSPWTKRTRMPRMKSTEIARRLGLEAMWLNGPWGSKRVSAGFLGGLIVSSLKRFARTGDLVPGPQHVPLPRAAQLDPGIRLLGREIRSLIAPKLAQAWALTTAVDGELPIDGNVIIKMWQLSNPVLPYDRIIVDEAQDMNDAARAVIEAQIDRSQLIIVGDTWQQINAWNGAVNALSKFSKLIDRPPLYLTNSWRFGPEIAERANLVLDTLGAPTRLVGRGAPGEVRHLDSPDVRLSRTNAEAVRVALEALADGRRPHIVGGATDVVNFAENVIELQRGGTVTHPELVCFDSWADVLAYVATDELGAELSGLVNLILKFGAQTIVDTMGKQPDEDDADIVLSTTHKIKGRQWPTVQIAGDFTVLPGVLDDVEELRLLYVAATRPRTTLDVCEPMFYPDRAPELEDNNGSSDDGDADRAAGADRPDRVEA